MASTVVAPSRQPGPDLRARRGLAAAFAAILACAAFMRLFHLEAYAWVPDQYERLIEAKALLAGHLPNSIIYPPGASLLVTPSVALLGPTPAAMQTMTAVLGIALVPLVYVWVIKSTADRAAALALAAACAVAPALVLPARSGQVDVPVTVLVVLAFMLVPWLRGRSLHVFFGFGLLLALLFNIRPTAVSVVPSLALYWLAGLEVALRPKPALAAVFSKEMMAAALGLSLPCAVSMLGGNWYGGAYGGLLSFDAFAHNMTYFWDSILLTWFGVVFFLFPAAVGLVYLWQDRRPLALGLGSFLIVWPASHSPFLFAEARYMAPAVVVLLFLVACGVSAAVSRRIALPIVGRVWCAMSLFSLSALFLLGSGLLLADWHTIASRTSAGAGAQMRPVLQALPSDAVVISAVTRTFQADGIPVEYVDLFDQSVKFREREAGVADLDGRTRRAVAAGRPVYYLYSHMENDRRLFGGIWGSFHAYFDGLSRGFEMVELARVQQGPQGDEPWILYQLVGPAPGDLPPAAPAEGASP